jgi:hypothetical protein
MSFSPRARRYGTSQTLSVDDGLTRKPVGDCCLCVVTFVRKRCLGSVVASRVAVSWLTLWVVCKRLATPRDLVR